MVSVMTSSQVDLSSGGACGIWTEKKLFCEQKALKNCRVACLMVTDSSSQFTLTFSPTCLACSASSGGNPLMARLILSRFSERSRSTVSVASKTDTTFPASLKFIFLFFHPAKRRRVLQVSDLVSYVFHSDPDFERQGAAADFTYAALVLALNR